MEVPLLTSGESRVYQALVELGGTSVGNIIKTSGVSHSKIYDILKRLSEKGLVSSLNKNGRQFFSAANPRQLARLFEGEEKQLIQKKEKMFAVIKQLEIRRNISKPTSILSSYEGFRGMQTALELVLDRVKRNKNPNHPKSSHCVRELPNGNGRGIFNVSDIRTYLAELYSRVSNSPF